MAIKRNMSTGPIKMGGVTGPSPQVLSVKTWYIRSNNLKTKDIKNTDNKHMDMDIRIWVQGMGQEQMLTNIKTKLSRPRI